MVRNSEPLGGIEMRHISFILGMVGILLIHTTAVAQGTDRVRRRELTDAENASLDDLVMPASDFCVKWVVAIIAKEVPINFPGLPKIEAFEQHTLVFDPGPENAPEETTAVFTWPQGSVDPATGAARYQTRIAGTKFRTAYGNVIWLFNIDSVLPVLRQGAMHFHVEMQPSAQPMVEIRPGILRDGTAWCYFDTRIGSETIVVSPKADGTYAFALRGGAPAPITQPVVAAAATAASATMPSPTSPPPPTSTENSGSPARRFCPTCGR